MPTILKNQIEDDGDADFEFLSPTQFLGSHTNMIPLPNAVQGTRLFYGARFYNQTVPIVGGEAPLVQNEDPMTGRSFDELAGHHLGAVFADKDAEVVKVDKDRIVLRNADGKTEDRELYHNFLFNTKSQITNTPLVKKGDRVKPGQLLAKSNYTDDKGNMAMGLNAKIALVPYKGHSMDDAVVISEDFANRLKSEAAYSYRQDNDVPGLKRGKNHFTNVFYDKFKKDQLETIGDDGVVLPGTKLNTGDPLILATKPRQFNSANLGLGDLSRVMQKSRSDASVVWDHETEGTVLSVDQGRKGIRVAVLTHQPTRVGDKLTLRPGQKSIVSHIIPNEHMPRTEAGEQLDVLLNQMALPSRVNANTVYELLLGKVARKRGEAIKLPPFSERGRKVYDMVRERLDEAGLTDTERVYDPLADRWLDNPVTVGDGYVLKLHHRVESKISSRGQSGYDNWRQPSKGGHDGGKAKRMSGLESMGLLSAGAYNVLRESSTLRGQQNDSYWRQLRMGHDPQEPGVPFSWDKYMALLKGAGMSANSVAGGKKGQLRLGFYTDKQLESERPAKIENGDVLDLTGDAPRPVKGGLFDDTLTIGNRWGYVELDEPTPNPAAEKAIRKLLGLTENEFREVLAGKRRLEKR